MPTPMATDACAPRSKSRMATPQAAARMAGAVKAMRSVREASQACAANATAAPITRAIRAVLSRRSTEPRRPTGAMNMRPIAKGTNALHGARAGPRWPT